MRKAALCGFALAMCLTTGCGDSAEKVMKDQIGLMNEMADILDTVKDKDTAEKAKPKLEALAKKGKEVEERAKKLKLDELPKDKQEALQAKFKDDLGKATARFMGVMMKIGTNKEVAEALKGVDLGMGGGK